MNLAVFDIDGTLTLGDGLGTRVFFEALERTFGAPPAERRLDGYAESTDGGIAEEAAAGMLGRAPHPDELDAFKELYLGLLAEEIAAVGRAYRPVDGAAAFLAFLSEQPRWRVAVATGNWRRAASLKLECAGLGLPAVAACSEDGATRAEVLGAAIASATRRLGGSRDPGFERVVYVGDQPWDLHAAARVGVGFLGVTAPAGPGRLAGHGVPVTEGYDDPERVLALLDGISARVPAKERPRPRT